MKPAAFDYHQASSVADALDALSGAADGDGKVIAGGQSLVPMLSMRLARPSVLVDINGLTELDYIRRDNGHLAIGAMTRARTVETSPEVRTSVRLLSEAMGFVGHVTIRNRGTIGGSAAHADPAAEVPAVLCALDAELGIAGPRGVRTVPARDFFHGFLTTALEPDELLIELRLPVLPAGTGCAVEELARRHGDFAIVAVFTTITVDGDGRCTDARIAIAGSNSTPVRAPDAEAALVGNHPTDDVIVAAARAMDSALFTTSDIHAPSEYRRQVAPVLARRALHRAASEAKARV